MTHQTLFPKPPLTRAGFFNPEKKELLVERVSHARNQKTPSDYLKLPPREREKQKISIIYEWLLEFHYSTRQVLLKRLGLVTHLHKPYFDSLEAKGILKQIKTFEIKSKHIYLLTTQGEKLALAVHGHKADYMAGHKRVKYNALRHDLAVQNYVIKLLPTHDSFIAERYIPTVELEYHKKPDACVIIDGKKRMLEIELSPKSVNRIYVAFTTHAEAISKGFYDEVIYVFPNDTLRKYYFKYFLMELWPSYVRNERGVWVRVFEKSVNIDQLGVRGRFTFLTDEAVVDGL